jgi:hypothetical protein
MTGSGHSSNPPPIHFGHEEAAEVPADLHNWRLMVNDEGRRYETCTRCGAYRDFDPRPGG